MSDVYEVIEPLPFQPPSQELLGLLHTLEENKRQLERAWIECDWAYEELYGFGELTALQTDRLLSR